MFTNLSVAVRRRHGMCKTDVIVTWSSSWQPWRHGRHSSWCGRPASVQCIWRHKGWKERSARGGGGARQTIKASPVLVQRRAMMYARRAIERHRTPSTSPPRHPTDFPSASAIYRRNEME